MNTGVCVWQIKYMESYILPANQYKKRKTCARLQEFAPRRTFFSYRAAADRHLWRSCRRMRQSRLGVRPCAPRRSPMRIPAVKECKHWSEHISQRLLEKFYSKAQFSFGSKANRAFYFSMSRFSFSQYSLSNPIVSHGRSFP